MAVMARINSAEYCVHGCGIGWDTLSEDSIDISQRSVDEPPGQKADRVATMRSDVLSRRMLLKMIGAAAVLPLVPASSAVAETPGNAGGPGHRILTCNILLDLPEQHGTPLDWNAHRRAVCEQVIKSRNPHIVCLQEVGRGQYEDFVKAFADFASFGFADPYIDTNPPRFKGCKNVILFSRERYELTSAGTYWLSETPLVAGSKLPGADLARHVTWLRLKDRHSGREFRILTTHWALKQPIREREAGMIVKEAGQYLPDFPQLLTGDFNSGRKSPEHKMLIDAGWKDTYEAVQGAGEPGSTRPPVQQVYHPAHATQGRIDFVFFRGKVKPVGAEIIRDSVNGVHPSDHHFVAADVEL